MVVNPENFYKYLKAKKMNKDNMTEEEIEIQKFIHHVFNKIKNQYVNRSSKKQMLIAARLTKGLSRIVDHECYLNQSCKDVEQHLENVLKTNHVKLKNPLTMGSVIHGEVLLLHSEEGRKFLKRSLKAGDYLFIYSYYIPCQGNKSSVSDCASMLKDFLLHNNADGKIAVILAYDKIWHETDKELAAERLSESGVFLVHLQPSEE